MKNINLVLIIVIGSLIISCSNEDSNLTSNYRVALGIDCDTPDPRTYYCVSYEEYKRTDDYTGPCKITTIVDIYGVTHSGVPNGWSSNREGFDCN